MLWYFPGGFRTPIAPTVVPGHGGQMGSKVCVAVHTYSGTKKCMWSWSLMMNPERQCPSLRHGECDFKLLSVLLQAECSALPIDFFALRSELFFLLDQGRLRAVRLSRNLVPLTPAVWPLWLQAGLGLCQCLTSKVSFSLQSSYTVVVVFLCFFFFGLSVITLA